MQSMDLEYCGVDDVEYDIWLNGSTQFTGKNVTPDPQDVEIALYLGNNVFILASIESSHLKMVKIQVYGPSEFTEIETRYRTDHPPECLKQETFNANCFQGVSAAGNYPVHLVAQPRPNCKKVEVVYGDEVDAEAEHPEYPKMRAFGRDDSTFFTTDPSFSAASDVGPYIKITFQYPKKVSKMIITDRQNCPGCADRMNGAELKLTLENDVEIPCGDAIGKSELTLRVLTRI